VLFAEERDVLITLRDVHQDLRLQLDAFEGGAIVAQSNLVFRASIDELEQPLGQARFRHLAQVEYVECFLHVPVGHRSPL
jgi:hypothetical protein